MIAIGSVYISSLHCVVASWALHLLGECATIAKIMIRSQLHISSIMLYKS